MKLKTLLTLVALSASSHGAAIALVNYNFTGNLATPAIVGTGSASDFTFSEGNINTTRSRYRSDWTANTVASTSFSATFDFTVGADTVATLSSVSMDYTNSVGTNNSAYGVALYASTDGVNYSLVQDNTTGGLLDTYSALSMDLTTFTGGDSYSSGDTIYFGVTVYDNHDATTAYSYIDNVKILGEEVVSSSIPEPASIVLLGLGGLACISRRKRS